MFRFLEFLRKQVDVLQMSQYLGIECDSDEELQEDETDPDYYSDDEFTRKVIDYDLDKMYEIVTNRDIKKWSLSTIHSKYKKISEGDAGRKQISR